ncbi:MAG: hypothetical protein V4525_04110 [Pseudomonadota bacterium]
MSKKKYKVIAMGALALLGASINAHAEVPQILWQQCGQGSYENKWGDLYLENGTKVMGGSQFGGPCIVINHSPQRGWLHVDKCDPNDPQIQISNDTISCKGYLGARHTGWRTN